MSVALRRRENYSRLVSRDITNFFLTLLNFNTWCFLSHYVLPVNLLIANKTNNIPDNNNVTHKQQQQR